MNTGRVYNLGDIGNMWGDNGIINSLVVEGTEVMVDIFIPIFFQDIVEGSVSALIGGEYYIAGLEDVFPTGEWVVGGVYLGVGV